MTKVLIVGDTHSDAQFVSNIHRAARENEVETIIQLGDFGFNFDRNMMESIYAWLDRDENHSWYWIDGNHDQHDYIEQDILSGVPNWNKPVAHFHERMFYCPRGAVFTIGNTKALALGGAYSIDEYYRTLGISYWEQETIRPSDMLRAVGNAARDGVDIMLTHDAPNSEELAKMLDGAGYKVDRKSAANRRNLTTVVDEVRPTKLYHGHYHHRYTTTYTTPEGWDVTIEGVGANVNPMSGHIDHTAYPRVNYLIEEW